MPRLAQLENSVNESKRMFDTMFELRKESARITRQQLSAHMKINIKTVDNLLDFIGIKKLKKVQWKTLSDKKNQFYRRLGIAKVLETDPDIHYLELMKKFGVGDAAIYTDIAWLTDKGFSGALKRARNKEKKARETVYRSPENKEKVLNYAIAHPYASVEEIAKAVGISERAAKDLCVAIIKERPELKKKIRIRKESIAILKRKEAIFEYKAKHPFATAREIAKKFKISEPYVGNILKEVIDEYNERNPEKIAEILATVINEYARILRICDEKLSQLKNPAHGARWLDHKVKVLENMAKLFNLGPANVQINQLILTKEEKDAAAAGLLKQIELQQTVKLPDFANRTPVQIQAEPKLIEINNDREDS